MELQIYYSNEGKCELKQAWTAEVIVKCRKSKMVKMRKNEKTCEKKAAKNSQRRK